MLCQQRFVIAEIAVYQALHELVARIEAEAAVRSVEVVGAELVGLMPGGAAAVAAGAALRIDGFDASRVLELRLLEPAEPNLD
jgi:glutamate formiminotransferase